MDTLELLYWCNKARALKESSFKNGKYTMDTNTSLKATRPLVANNTEEQIASYLIFSAPNDIEDWYCELTGKTRADINEIYDLKEEED